MCGLLKYDTNELTYKRETDSQTQRNSLMVVKWGGGHELAVWD